MANRYWVGGTGNWSTYSSAVSDSFVITMGTGGWAVYGGDAYGQTFTGNGSRLNTSKFFLSKVGAPTGNVTAEIYAVTGTYGSTTKPVNGSSPVAISDPIAASSVSTGVVEYTFTFSAANRISLVSGTRYAVVINLAGNSSSNHIVVCDNNTSGTSSAGHAGNATYKAGASWYADSSWDVPFVVITSDSPWSDTSGGAGGATVPTSSDDVFFNANSFTATGQTVSITATANSRSMDWTGVTNNPTIAGSSSLYVNGDLTLVSGMTWSLTGTLGLEGGSSTSYTYNFGGQTLHNASVNFNSFGATGRTMSLASNIVLADGLGVSNNLLRVTAGTFNANGYSVTTPRFAADFSNTRTINMGSGTWTMTGTGTVWNLISTSLTLNANTSTLVINNTSSTSKSITSAGKNLNNLTISGDNVLCGMSTTVANLAINNAGLTNGFKLGATLTVTGNITSNGAPVSLAKLGSTIAGTQRTISKASGSVSLTGMHITDSAASGGATFTATDSTDGGNNTGWTFINPPVLTTGIASGTSTDSITVTGSSLSNPSSVTINEYGVAFSTSPSPTIANSSQLGTGTEADFNNTLTGLSEDTTYYIRSYAKWNTTNYAYGNEVTRKTQDRPAITLNAPADAATASGVRPNLDFTGVDNDNSTISYQLQLHTSDVWTAPQLEVMSAFNNGFSNRSDSKTDPFYSGNQIRYTPQSDLTRSQTYYWRVRGRDNIDGSNTWGEWTTARSFTVPAVAPTVSLTTVYDVSFDTAEVDAEVTADGGGAITERGVVYATTQNPTTADSKVVVAGTTGAYTASLTALAGSTTYYARAYAVNSAGAAYSSPATFTTLETPSAPTVVTGTAVNTLDISSEFNGNNVTAAGTATVTERGIVFSDTEAIPTTDDRKIVAPAIGLGTYDLDMTGLDPSTLYYVRAYAINSIGTGYGDVVTFTTEDPFMPDEGDGYWTWTPSGSDAVVGRSQSTNANSSADLMLADLGLTDGLDYTLYYSGSTSDQGETKVVLQWYDGATKTQQLITPGTAHTFTYDEAFNYWSIRLFVTGASVEADNINATFSDMYLAQESTFSGYVPFVANGLTEVKIENNWLVDKQRSDVIGTMFDAMNGLAWFPFDIDTEGLGWFEIGDRFTIQDSDANEYSVVLWNSKLTVDGGIQETLHTKAPDLTETNYNKAGKLNGLWKRTQIEVDHNTQEIESLVEAVYDYDGVINTQFSEVFQDIDQVRTTIQGSGGVNLIKNSVMYAFNTDNEPDSWTVTGAGTLVIQSSPESLTAGAVAGNAFTLSDKTATQTITVRKNVDFIPEDDKTYYSISAKVKKNTVGTASITLTNRNETLTIPLPDQTEYYWDTVKLEEILPLDDHYEISITSDADADLQVTDLIFAPGKTKREWTQANGEVMNTSVSITEDGMTIRSPQFQNDYVSIDALGFEVHSKEVGGERVFGFNKDETNVSKLKSDNQISMPPMRTVPINYGTYKGWAFTLSEETL